MMKQYNETCLELPSEVSLPHQLSPCPVQLAKHMVFVFVSVGTG